MQPQMKKITEHTSKEELENVRYFLQVFQQDGKHIPVVWYTVKGIKSSNNGKKMSVTVGQKEDHNFILNFKEYNYYSIDFVDSSLHFMTTN